MGINSLFLDYYATLYMSESSSNSPASFDFLNSLTLPKIDEDHANNLGGPITELEIQEAIKSMQSGKSPGPDGFTAEFYKSFLYSLTPTLARLYNDYFKEGRLPPTFCETSISLLLKKDKDPTACGSYRPVSLLNVDLKILAKVLSSHLQLVLPSLICLSDTRETFVL